MTSKRGMLLCNLARQGMNALPSKNQEEEHFEVSDKVCEVVPNQDIGQHNNNDLKVLQWFKDNPEIDYIEETIEQIETINMDIVEEVIGTVKETAVDNVNDANITEEILLYQLGSNNREDSEKDETDFSGTNSDRDKDFVPDKRKKRKLVTSLNSSTSCSSSSSSTTSSSSSTSSSSDSESTKSTNLPSTSNQINTQLLDDQPSSSAHRIATQDSNDEVNIMEVRPQLECEFQNMPVTTKSKKKCRNPAAWKQNIRKALKNTGQEHTNSSGKIIPAKKIGPPCSEKCLISCSKRISIAERQELFTGYWELGSLTRQQDYVASCISTLAPEYRRLKSEPKFARKPNSCFYLPLNGDKIRVCKTFFLNTLAITTRFLRHIINIRTTTGTLPPDKRGTLTKKRIDTEMHESVRAHINSIPRIESHYLRAQTTRQYIDGQYTVADLHRLYCEYRKENNKPCATYDFYYRVFNQEFNLSFFTPKKDQCDQCVSYNNLSKNEQSLKEDEYRLHLKEKTLSREEKQADMRLLKEEGHENLIVAIYDLQAVLPVPIGNSSAFFYKSKLNCYNFTVTDFKEKKTSCFFWHEGLGNRGVNEIGSCVYLYLQELARKHPNCDVIFYSDNCCGQQKNKFMVNLYYYAVNTLAINTIQHKFLIRGHTQSEADSVHSVIEKAVKRAKKSGPIYVPDQYCQLIRSAKKTGNPFFVKEMNFSDFYDLKCLTEDNNLNINKAKNGRIIKISEIRQLKFIKGNVYYFKTSYEGEWIEVERNHTVTRSTRVHQPQEVALKQAYACKMPLAARKKADIQSLIDTNIIPKVYECIYNTIF